MARDDESDSEKEARRALETVLGLPLTRIAPRADGMKTHDYEATIANLPTSYEVKRVATEEFLELANTWHREQFWPSTRLAHKWVVMIDAPTNGDRLAPPPDYPEDDEDQIARIESSMPGLTVQRKADRVRQWKDERSGQRQNTVRLRGLGRDIEDDLLVLEASGVATTRAIMPDAASMEAWFRIGQRTGGAICSAALDANPGPGVELMFTYGYSRDGQTDTLVGRVQVWLDSDLSSNLIATLQNATTARREAVLVFDSQTEPEYDSAQSPDFVPATPLDMPSPIDALWCIVGRAVLRYTALDGWSRHEWSGMYADSSDS